MIFDDEEERTPDVIGMKNIMLAAGLHIAVFSLFWLFSAFHFKEKETVIPIELVFEAPPEEVSPEDVPEPNPPEPEPPNVTPKPPEPPPVVEEKVDAVVKIKDEKKKEEKKPEKPKEKPKPPEPEKPKQKPEEKKPEKTKEQIKKEKEEAKKERLRKMRESAKNVKNPKKYPVTGTGQKLDPNWEKLLKQGYKPSDHTELAKDEVKRIISTLEQRWNELSPTIGREGVVCLKVDITKSGRLVNCRIEKSCGDALSDKAALMVASTVGEVDGLSPEFISKNKTVTINYTVKGR